MLPVLTYIVCEIDLIKYMLSRPIMKGRISKWSLAFIEFSFQFKPQKSVKGQAIATILADHPQIARSWLLGQFSAGALCGFDPMDFDV